MIVEFPDMRLNIGQYGDRVSTDYRVYAGRYTLADVNHVVSTNAADVSWGQYVRPAGL
jgi:hypothetical protein